MSLTEAMDQYKRALKQGQKDYRADVLRGRYPYPQVLDEILVESMCAGRVDLGLIEIPINQIVGTKSAGRKSAFASSFMPLLPIDTEFGAKWVKLCEAHLGDEGIGIPSSAMSIWVGSTWRRATSASASSRATAHQPSPARSSACSRRKARIWLCSGTMSS